VEPEDVLDLIRTAPERYETVRAALRYKGDGPVRKEIRDRIAHSEARRHAFQISPREASEAIERFIDHPEPDAPFGWRCRAWHSDRYHWRMETEVPGGGVAIAASTGRRRLPIGGPSCSGLVWDRRIGAGPREDDPRWFELALDHYWTFYPLLTDEICGISHELRPWISRWRVRCGGQVGRLCASWACRARSGIGGGIPTPSVGAQTSTRCWWTPSVASYCAVPRG
jgi:hypothetical protein